MVAVIGNMYTLEKDIPVLPNIHRVQTSLEPSTIPPLPRKRLPLFPALEEAFLFTKEEIATSTLAKGKDSAPLPKGKYPSVDTSREILTPSSHPAFHNPAVEDSALGRMGKQSNPAHSSNFKLTLDTVRKMEKDLRVATSSLSSALWAVRAADQLLGSLSRSAPANSSLQDSADLVSASGRWLLTVADRMIVTLSSLILMRRDGALANFDTLVPPTVLDQLRSVSLLSPSLFGELALPTLTELDRAREAAKPTQAIREIAQLTKQLTNRKATTQPKPGTKRTFTQASVNTNAPAASTFRPKSAAPSKTPNPTTTSTSSEVTKKKKRFRGPKKSKKGGN